MDGFTKKTVKDRSLTVFFSIVCLFLLIYLVFFNHCLVHHANDS